MRNGLMDTLLRRGLISSDTIVTAKIGTKNKLGGMHYSIDDYVIKETLLVNENWGLLLQSVIGQVRIRTNDDAIVAIDGMSIDRYADVYNINHDGTDKRVGKKRGRKPKNLTA